ncbi:MAG: N-acetylgalactosamine 6-sulfate sulfatase, partial [Planctomycetes bacterium]|nr:N-acetylgalactosamine 6-sulfate sulfatase [Planctomycetota bacterium]
VRIDRFKGIRTKCYQNPDGPIELYDLKSDIGEQTDVAADHPEIVEKMDRLLRDEHADSPLWDFNRAKRPKPR